MSTEDRIRRFLAVSQMGEHRPEEQSDVEALDDVGKLDRFLLVEHGDPGRYAHRRWFTTHETAQAAHDYHRDQEYSNDWHVGTLVDLDTGEEIAGDLVFVETSRRPLAEIQPEAPPAALPALSDSEAVDEITAILSGCEWDSDTPDAVAEIVRRAGRVVADVS